MKRTRFSISALALMFVVGLGLPTAAVLADPPPTPTPASPAPSSQRFCQFLCAPRAAPGSEGRIGDVRIPCSTDNECASACRARCEVSGTGPDGNGLPTATGQGLVCAQNPRPTCVLPAAPPSATPATPAPAASPTIELPNPLGNTTDLVVIFGRVVKAVMGILGALALMWLVAGGMYWMTAAESKRTEEAKTMIKNAALGIVLLFFSYGLATAFLGIFEQAARNSTTRPRAAAPAAAPAPAATAPRTTTR